MAEKAIGLEKVLTGLEKFYGTQPLVGPSDAYEMILYRNAGYPQSDERCTKGFEALKREIGLKPEEILSVPHNRLAEVLRSGGIMPELRANRLKEIAKIVLGEFGGDLNAALNRGAPEARKALKKFPTISDAGADKILLFGKVATVAALPSNCIHVPLRLGFGVERKNWATSYREAQEAVCAELPENGDAYRRAYLLLKRHGEELCKAARPRCPECPVAGECAYYRKIR